MLAAVAESSPRGEKNDLCLPHDTCEERIQAVYHSPWTLLEGLEEGFVLLCFDGMVLLLVTLHLLDSGTGDLFVDFGHCLVFQLTLLL